MSSMFKRSVRFTARTTRRPPEARRTFANNQPKNAIKIMLKTCNIQLHYHETDTFKTVTYNVITRPVSITCIPINCAFIFALTL